MSHLPPTSIPMPTRVMQWKFTSCGYNIENRSGFSTFSMSQGLTDEDREDLVRHAGGYSPPEGLPSQPVTQDELDLFPIALASFRLRSGKRAVTRTRYVGKDYAGVRFGNLFSHGLIIDGDWPFHSIQLWEPGRGSRLWADGLTDEEQNLRRTPDPLPVVAITPEHLFPFDIPEFLDHPDRYEWFKSLFDALRKYPAGKTIVLRDNPVDDSVPGVASMQHNAVHWIAALQYILPPGTSQDISFSSYVRTGKAAGQFQVAATSVHGSAIDFHSPDLTVQFFPFDFAAGTSPPPTTDTEFTRRFLAYDFPGQELKKVYRWMDECGLAMNLYDNSPESIVLLHDFMTTPLASLTDGQFQQVMQFFSTQSHDVRNAILEKSHLFHHGETMSVDRLQTMLPLFADSLYTATSTTARMQKSFEDFFVKQFVANRLDRMLALFHQLPEFARYRIFLQLLKLRYSRETLKIILPVFFETVLSSPDSIRPQLLAKFSGFVISLFRIPVSESEMHKDCNDLFREVNSLFHSSEPWRKFGNDLLSQLEQSPATDTVFLQTFLVFALHVHKHREISEKPFEALATTIQTLTPPARECYRDSVLPFAVDLATTPEVHQMIVEVMFGDSIFDFDEFARYYVTYIEFYGSRGWKDGKPAKPQANAFLCYVTNNRKTFEKWTKRRSPKDTPPVAGLFFALSLRESLFDNKGKFLYEDEAGRYNNNLISVLMPLVTADDLLSELIESLSLEERHGLSQNLLWIFAGGLAMVTIGILLALLLLLTPGSKPVEEQPLPAEQSQTLEPKPTVPPKPVEQPEPEEQPPLPEPKPTTDELEPTENPALSETVPRENTNNIDLDAD